MYVFQSNSLSVFLLLVSCNILSCAAYPASPSKTDSVTRGPSKTKPSGKDASTRLDSNDPKPLRSFVKVLVGFVDGM